MTHSPFVRRATGALRLSSTSWLLVLLLYATAPAKDVCPTPDRCAPCAACRPQDEIWLLDVRDACTVCGVDCEQTLDRLKVSKFDHCSQWSAASLAEFLTRPDSPTHTVVWVHGNRVERCEAGSEGLLVYRSLVAHAPEDRPIRFVIWSWPSEQIRGPLRDVREKAYRSDPAAAQLACLLNRLDPETQIGLIGFSFGARVITGALHHLSGKPLDGFAPLVPSATKRAPLRAVLMASALDCDWLLPGHYNGMALLQVESLLLINNSCDHVLKRYRHLDRCRRAEALGYVGMPHSACLGDNAVKVRQFDAAGQIGRDHHGESYYCNSFLMGMAWASLAGTE